MAPTRRTVLTTAGAVLASVAGCGGSGSDAGTDDQSTTAGSATADGSPSPTGDGATPELDLREANVTAVSLTDAGDGQYRFDVTLYHDDDGESGYADWWQVERLDGERLGRRELLHAHSTAPFTRSETVGVPAETDCVVVRGHDQTHGYGGQAMAVAVPDGATRAVRQGPDSGPVAPADCP